MIQWSVVLICMGCLLQVFCCYFHDVDCDELYFVLVLVAEKILDQMDLSQHFHWVKMLEHLWQLDWVY